MVARCEHDAIMPTASGKVFINVKALNEWNPKVKVHYPPTHPSAWILLIVICLAFWRCRLEKEVGFSTRCCVCHRTEEQQLQDSQMGNVHNPCWLQLHKIWVTILDALGTPTFCAGCPLLEVVYRYEGTLR